MGGKANVRMQLLLLSRVVLRVLARLRNVISVLDSGKWPSLTCRLIPDVSVTRL